VRNSTPLLIGQVVISTLAEVIMKANYIDKKHWEELYATLHDAYVSCMHNNNPTYEQKLAQVLDHMIYNKPYYNIR